MSDHGDDVGTWRGSEEGRSSKIISNDGVKGELLGEWGIDLLEAMF